MSIFRDITIKWKGVEHVISSDRVMRAIAVVEDHVTLDEVSRAISGAGIKRVKLSEAFAALLNYAGVKVTPEEVYEGMFVKGSDNAAIASTMVLLSLMVPPTLTEEDIPQGNASRRDRRAASSSSKKRTK